MKEKQKDCCEKNHSTQTNATIAGSNLESSLLVESIFEVQGMDCADEVTAIQAALRGDAVHEVHANLIAGTVSVKHLPSLGASLLKQKIESTGVRVNQSSEEGTHSLSNRRLVFVGLSGILAGLGFGTTFFISEKLISATLFIASTLMGGSLVFPKAVRSIKQLHLDINVLMTVAVAGAFVIGEFSEAATVVFLFAISELLESYGVLKARKAIREVMELAPSIAFVINKNGEHIETPIDRVKIGETVLVKSGGKIPVDGIIKSGSSLINQAPLTGESVPVVKNAGDSVFAGTVNESGALEIEVTKLVQDSKASQIIKMIEEAQKEKAPAQRFVDTFARYYTPSVFVVALLSFLIPPLLFQGQWYEWLYRSLVLLVIACPCALVISTPISIVAGLASLAKRGVLVKGGVYLEVLGKIRAIAVDKTGTITYGKPAIREIHSQNGMSEVEIIQVAASLEAFSSHPLATAILGHARERSISLKTASHFKTIVGYGVEAEIDGHLFFLGNHRFAHESKVCDPKLEALLSQLEEKSLSIVIVGHKPHENCKGEVLGVIALGDKIRENAAQAIAKIRSAGVQRIIMLSGDNNKTARSIAAQAGIEEVRSELLPEDKAVEMKKLVSEHGIVAMVGDGINDAPALAEASLGIAMGVAGTDTAIETADVALMRDDLEEVSAAIEQGRRVLLIIKANIAIALAMKAVFLALALIGHTNLWLAVAADTGTTLLVAANALRLLKVRSSSS